MTKKTQDKPAIDKVLDVALRSIAAQFEDKIEYNTDDGEVREWDRLWSVKEKILGGILYNLKNAVDYSEHVELPRLKDNFQREESRNDHGEISLTKMQTAVRKMAEANDKIAAMQVMIKSTEAVYSDMTGRDHKYTPRITPQRSGAEEDEDRKALIAQMKALTA